MRENKFIIAHQLKCRPPPPGDQAFIRLNYRLTFQQFPIDPLFGHHDWLATLANPYQTFYSTGCLCTVYIVDAKEDIKNAV